MVSVFRRSLKTGIVTKRYPAEPEPAPDAFRGQVQLDTDRCTGDGACARVCPATAISVQSDELGWVWSLTDARCVFCGLCEGVCESGAIRLSNEFELATLSALDLTTTVRFTRRSGT